jgi:hypothetical protein
LTPGSSSFIGGDNFTLDVYPLIGDIRMAKDEYPMITADDLQTRTSGGSAV